MKETRSLPARISHYLALMRRRAQEGHLSLPRQLAEVLALGLLTGNGPGYYLCGGFYQRDVSWGEKRMHLGAKEYRARVSVLNPERLRSLTQNKLVEKSLLTALGFPTPRFVGFLHPELGRTSDGQSLRTKDQFEALIGQYRGRRLVFKILEGWAGQGFVAADIDSAGDAVRVADLGKGPGATPVSAEQFYSRVLEGQGSTGRLIEEYFLQHPEVAAFNPSSVNTCRVWVAGERAGPARAVLAYLRMGRGGSLVDNQSAGGIVAPIDLETGALRAAVDGLPERTVFERHPDHGARIAGFSIPFWAEAKPLAEECVKAFPGLRFAGVDVAIGPAGPAILELNASPDREGSAFVGIPSGAVVPKG